MARRRNRSRSPGSTRTGSPGTGGIQRRFGSVGTRGPAGGSRPFIRVHASLYLPSGAPRVVWVSGYRPRQSEPLRLGRPNTPLRRTRVLLLIEREGPHGRSAMEAVKRGNTVYRDHAARAIAAARESHGPTNRNDRKGRSHAGGHIGRVRRDRNGIIAANASSARQMDLAAAYVLGRNVRRHG